MSESEAGEIEASAKAVSAGASGRAKKRRRRPVVEVDKRGTSAVRGGIEKRRGSGVARAVKEGRALPPDITPYEARFGTRSRGRGRPTGRRGGMVFNRKGKDPELSRIAEKRAKRLVMDENRLRLRDVYEAEYHTLAGRDRETVMSDDRGTTQPQ